VNARNLIFYFLEKYFFLKPYNVFISSCKTEVDYFRMLEKQTLHIPIFGFYGNEGLEMKDRNEAKLKLGITTKKKIILQIGRAIGARGFDWIIEFLDDPVLQNEFLFLFAGIDKEDEYYMELKKRGYEPLPYSAHNVLNNYYNAADVLIYLPHGEMDLAFAGTSYVPLEALFCGTPVVATTFIHFPGESKNLVSRTPEKKENVIPMVRELLSSEVERNLCRKTMMDEYSWDKVLPYYLKIYKGEI
jgi:glycosyltransferase involved in cell wall biosynthesis